MPARGQSILVTYYAWDTSANTYKTGDAGNHTLRLNKDGTVAAPTNANAEVDATNLPGLYQVALTSAEATFNIVDLGGKSSTVNIVLIGKTYAFDALPVGGFLTSAAQIGVNVITVQGVAAATSAALGNSNVVSLAGAAVAAASGILQTNPIQWLGVAPAPLTGTLLLQTAQSGNIAGSVGSVTGNVGGNVVGSVASVTARVTANTDQIAGGTVNALLSGRVDVSVGQVQTNAIGAAAYVAGALGTTVFASQFLTSALIDTTYPNALADALLDRANAIETGITPRKAWRYEVAAAAGALSGAGTTQVNIWGAGVSTTRITAVTDQSGNRASVTLA